MIICNLDVLCLHFDDFTSLTWRSGRVNLRIVLKRVQKAHVQEKSMKKEAGNDASGF